MVQTAVPEEDVLNQGWQNEIGATPIYGSVADQSDLGWIASPSNPIDIVYVTRLTHLNPPEDLAGDWTIKFRAAKMLTSATPLNLIVELRQFYVDETDTETIGELIASMTIIDVPDTLTNYEFIVPDVSFVTATMDLTLRVIADTGP